MYLDPEDLDEMDLDDYLDSVREDLALTIATAPLFEIPTLEYAPPKVKKVAA